MADPGSPATLTPAGEGATATETPATGVRVSVDHQLPEQVDVIDISSFEHTHTHTHTHKYI